jgi:hypothetical protein
VKEVGPNSNATANARAEFILQTGAVSGCVSKIEALDPDETPLT